MSSMQFVQLHILATLPVLICYVTVSILFITSGVRSYVAKSVFVEPSGGGDFTTVQAAIDSVPVNNAEWIRIHVKAGTYNEKVRIPNSKPFIYLEGEGRDQTAIVWGDHALDSSETEWSDTEWSATFTVLATDFVAKDISFKNSFMPISSEMRQAVAATIGADRSALYGCGFYGLQDTLNDYIGRHFYSSCYIEGVVDFIFGFGQSLYQDCYIVATTYSSIILNGTITAQGRNSETDPSGFVFDGCHVSGPGKTLLGRAWKSYSRVIFSNTTMSDAVLPQGWDSWGNPTENIFYAENLCSGPGSDATNRVHWELKLNQDQINRFVSMDFINGDGWLEEQARKVWM